MVDWARETSCPDLKLASASLSSPKEWKRWLVVGYAAEARGSLKWGIPEVGRGWTLKIAW